jgi:membrane-associated phospholipid phosphatase
MNPMGDLWQWDINAFRAIHLAGRDLIADPFLQCLTNMGLTHIQVLPLLIAYFRPKMPVWAQSLVIGVGLSLCYLIEERAVPGAAAFALCLVLFWCVPPRAALGAVVAAIFSGALRVLVEAFVDRQRPTNFDFVRPLEPVFGNSSFPSGHATTSMAIAIYLLWSLKGKDRPLAYLSLAWAILVGLTRIVAGVHYPLDVLSGFALAAVVATAIKLLFDAKGWPPEKSASLEDA